MRADELSERIYLILQGSIRLLAINKTTGDSFTLDKRGPGQLIGWSSLLRGKACELTLASEKTLCLSIRANSFISAFQKQGQFSDYFQELNSLHETYEVISSATDFISKMPQDWEKNIIKVVENCVVRSISSTDQFTSLSNEYPGYRWYLSSAQYKSLKPGIEICDKLQLNSLEKSSIPCRLVGIPEGLKVKLPSQDSFESSSYNRTPEFAKTDLVQLGIVDPDIEDNQINFPFYKGYSPLSSTVSVVQMLASYYEVPFRKEAVEKIVENHIRKGKYMTLQFGAYLYEILGFSCRVARVRKSLLQGIETPFVILDNTEYEIVYQVSSDEVTLASPKKVFTQYQILTSSRD